MSEHAAALAELSQWPHVLHVVDFAKNEYDGTSDCVPTSDLDAARGISSEIASGVNAGMHTVAIDLDVSARLIPSTTPGHSHLYIDAPMNWHTYLSLLTALASAGVIEQGYRDASERRGHTTLRLPWIKKDEIDASLRCIGCSRHPSQIGPYDSYARDEGVSNAEYVQRNEGTLNRRNGHFYCDVCYIKAGQPLGVAP